MRRDGSEGGARILVVEDDRALRRALAFALSAGGYAVEVAENGQHGLTRLAATDPDAVVLDVGLPDIDGIALCRRLRGAGNRVPVLMLSGRDDVEHRIDGLDAGADDYLCEPFDVGELRARLRALLRRVAAGDAVPGRGSETSGSTASATREGARHVRRALAHRAAAPRAPHANAGTVLPHAVIYGRVWGYDFGPEANSLRVYVGDLRRKLADAGAGPVIDTVRGVGYVLRRS